MRRSLLIILITTSLTHRPLSAAPCGESCPSVEWVAFSGGELQLGDARVSYQAEARPLRLVSLSPFQLSKREVQVSAYAACVAAEVCDAPMTGAHFHWERAGYEAHPMNGVSWYEARRFAAWVGARLPSEAEWSLAAKGGTAARAYPWGEDAPSCALAQYGGCGLGASPSCAHGESVEGLCDLAGNLSEWVLDLQKSRIPALGDAPHCLNGGCDGAPQGRARVIRGGAFNESVDFLYNSYRRGMRSDRRSRSVGFRLARDFSPSNALPGLVVAEPDPARAAYDRDDWPHWSDEDGDCVNTRHEVLITESQEAVEMVADAPCRVESGRWHDPYTGLEFNLANSKNSSN